MNLPQQTTQYMVYRISVQDHLDGAWMDCLNSTVAQIEQTGDTSITSFIVSVPDQPALRGLLSRLWNLNLTLVSLQLLDS